MLEFFKKYRYFILITSVYTTLAALVYGIWSYSAWQLWYITLLIVIVIVAIGFLVGYLWIKAEINSKIDK